MIRKMLFWRFYPSIDFRLHDIITIREFKHCIGKRYSTKIILAMNILNTHECSHSQFNFKNCLMFEKLIYTLHQNHIEI